MLQKLGDHIVNCLTEAEAAERYGKEASDISLQSHHEWMAQAWRHLARSYQFVDSLEHFLFDAEKSKRARRPDPPIEGAGFIFSETHHGSAAGATFTTLSNADDLQPGSTNLNGLRVLVVEDSWQVSAALKRLLEACGADVAGPVATVADAARLVSERPIDVALVDINLRGGELAYDLIDKLHNQGIRIVVVTGYADVSIDEKKVAAVLQKPISGPLLLQSLRPAALSK